MIRHRYTWLVTSLLLLPMLACGPTSQPELVATAVSTPSATLTPEPTEAPPSEFGAGDVIRLGDLTFVVLGWTEVPGDEFTQPAEGNRFVAVELLAANTGTASTNLLTTMSLTDGRHNTYSPDVLSQVAVGRPNPAGDLAPGERVRGMVGFQIPAEAVDLLFAYDASTTGASTILVKLGVSPGVSEPPADFPGEAAPGAVGRGQPTAIEGLRLTVLEVTNPPGGTITQPQEGYQFVVVELSIENTGSEPQNVSSNLHMWLKDSASHLYGVDPTASAVVEGSTPDGELAPGETLRGFVGFQVPVEAQGLVFVFDSTLFAPGKVFVALGQ